MATQYVTDRGLRLSPDLYNRELASPRRRLAAWSLDFLIVFMPTVVVTVVIASLVLMAREPVALQALGKLISGGAEDAAGNRALFRDLVPLMVEYNMPGTPPETIVAYHQGDLERAVKAFGDKDIVVTIGMSDSAIPPDAPAVHLELGRLMPKPMRLVTLYGVAALYFTLFLRGSRGATPAKRWLGVRVVRIDGSRLSVLESFERFVGYAQIPASFGTALLDFWRDPNRRLPHDRLSGTIVIRAKTG